MWFRGTNSSRTAPRASADRSGFFIAQIRLWDGLQLLAHAIALQHCVRIGEEPERASHRQPPKSAKAECPESYRASRPTGERLGVRFNLLPPSDQWPATYGFVEGNRTTNLPGFSGDRIFAGMLLQY
jgi:hypothetical protein